jgi:hypothetical protein
MPVSVDRTGVERVVRYPAQRRTGETVMQYSEEDAVQILPWSAKNSIIAATFGHA